jgi:hypothetical protein
MKTEIIFNPLKRTAGRFLSGREKLRSRRRPPRTHGFAPQNPPELKPMASRDTPAYQAAKLFLHGVNLGDYLEAPPKELGRHDWRRMNLRQMQRAGFDHVRVPVGWHHYAGPAPDFTLSPEIFARVDFVVTNTLANKMAVMINIHHFDELDRIPAGSHAGISENLAANRGPLPGFPPAARV